ncbi:MAG: PH domain-containing protein [Halobacteriota archaeon]
MRLSPLTVPFRAFEVAVGLGSLAIFIVIGLATLLRLDGLMIASVAAVAIVVVLAIAIGYSLAYYRRFDYELTEDTFDVHSGVFARRDREVPYYRVQNVSIAKNVVHRLLGIAEVRVETAGGDSAEVHLRYVADGEASRLQQELTERKRDRRTATSPAEETARHEEFGQPLFVISPGELALLGVISFDLRTVAFVLALAIFLDPGTMADLLVAIPAIAMAPAAIVAVYFVGAAVSGLVAVTNYWDFRLTRLSDELRFERGLLRQFSGSIPLTKVQSMQLAENVLARRIGYARLLIETASFSPGEASGSQTAVPIASRQRVIDLAQSIEPFDDPVFTRPPRRARERYVVRYTAVVLVVTALTYGIDRSGVFDLAWPWTLALLTLVPVAAHLKWLNLGVAIQDDYVVTMAGFWTRRIHIVPYHRTQTVYQRQTIFQRRRRLASVRIDTAGSRSLVGQDAVAVDLDVGDASALRELVHDRLQAQLEVNRQGFEWLDGVAARYPR